MTMNADSRVAVVHDAALAYSLAPPFDPPDPVYDAVLGLLERLGLDPDHAGTPAWNPLGEFVGPPPCAQGQGEWSNAWLRCPPGTRQWHCAERRRVP